MMNKAVYALEANMVSPVQGLVAIRAYGENLQKNIYRTKWCVIGGRGLRLENFRSASVNCIFLANGTRLLRVLCTL